MKVILVSGSYPPQVCGIGHYTSHLACALQAAGAEIEVVSGPGWGFKRVRRLVRSMQKSPKSFLHIQYPGEGFGWSVAPQILTILRPSVVTIHELSRASRLRKASVLPFLLAARRLVFTSCFELAVASKWLPWIRRKSTVIEIGNNIPVSILPGPRVLDEITYFGLIVPNKGIEEVLTLASLAQQQALPVRVRFIGATLPRFADYARRLEKQSKGLPVDLNLDMNEETTGRLLARAAVAYLPFPDGASTRRGSLKALLAFGTAVITTQGAQTTSPLAKTVLFASTPEQALKLAVDLFADPDRLSRISLASIGYAETFGWAEIAAEHLIVYRQFADGMRRAIVQDKLRV